MKSSTITIGKSEAGDVRMDVGRLVRTRAIVLANSGGGKSWLLRLMCEQLGKTVQVIVLDDEGEFQTLREKLDVLLVGEAGEVPCDVRSAGLLARRLLELRISAVINLNELQLGDRREYVRLFCTAMVDAPKSLWHPCAIVLDEAQRYCPERGFGEADSTDAVLALASQGRKRRFCLIPATQRLSKVRKDLVAECRNQFLGLTTFDDDQKRAAPLLGIKSNEAVKLRDLPTGDWYGYGPALLTAGVTRFHAGRVTTTHGDDAGGTIEPPEPSKKIRTALAELQDLPKEAEAEIKDLAAARTEIYRLLAQVKVLEIAAAKSPMSADVRQRLSDANALAKCQAQKIAQLRRGLEDAMKVIAEINSKSFAEAGVDPEQIRKAVEAAAVQIVKMADQSIARKQSEFDRLKRDAGRVLQQLHKLLSTEDVQVNTPFTVSPMPTSARVAAPAPGTAGTAQLKPVERALLTALAQHPEGLTKGNVLIYANYRKSGDTAAAFRRFASEGWTSGNDTALALTASGLDALGSFDPLPHGAELREKILREAKPVEAKILGVLFEAFPRSLGKGEALERAGYRKSGDTASAFRKFLRLGWIQPDCDNAVKASPVLFPDRAGN